MSDQKGELSFDLTTILRKVTESVVQAAQQLHNEYYNEDSELINSPHIYVIPSSKVSLKLTIGYSNGKVKGVFKKTQSTSSQELVSTVDLEIVSTPRINRPES
ncbi:MAG: hypothetical protein AAF600_16690 [Bacteroidota bacterium]